jgi:hypothetical protein
MRNKFDELAKSLAGPSTRRQMLKKFSVGLAATALACFGLADKAKADTGGCKASGKPCTNNSECCSGYCQTGFGKYKHPPHGTCY